MSIRVGQIVFSKRGRDKGLPFVVVDTTADYVCLSDGLLRPLNKPKKKKIMHVQPVNQVFDLAAVAGQRGLLDSDIRKLLLPFKKVEEVCSIV